MFKLTAPAWKELFQRYAMVFSAAWQQRKKWDQARYNNDESEFLPAALALQQKVLSPAPRVALWLLMGFALLALLWSLLGKVDIVASAQGKIIPNAGTQLVQPVGTAIVKGIYVHEGQSVRAGDVLIELDGTITRAEQQRLLNEIQTWSLQVARAEAMLISIDHDQVPTLNSAFPVNAAALADEQRLALSEYFALQAKLSGIRTEITRRQAEYQSTVAGVRKLEKTTPIARQRAESLRILVDEQYVARNAYLERERALIEQESDLVMQRSRLKEIQASIAEARQQLETTRANARHANSTQLNEARQKIALLEQDLVKARKSDQLTRLIAPVSGTVQQLAVRTVGGVVTEAQSLMLIVPENDQLEIQAYIENKDVGFVRPGQEAELKIETFPYVKYGVLTGKVKSVSDDAINDEKRGLVFSMRILMDQSTMLVNGSNVRLAPGMAVVAEVKTGRRRIIEYFLDPLKKYGQESIRER